MNTAKKAKKTNWTLTLIEAREILASAVTVADRNRGANLQSIALHALSVTQL